jgi:methylenetetrahydrofolate--tRNA-(uracil-5-)-methyltransferase
MPIEELAKRGYQTPLFGPMKPVGLVNRAEPDKKYHAVVQLRRENSTGDLFNMVGFQTRLLFDEQKRVFRMIPGLENAEFLRYGVMHRNTYIDSPRLLDQTNRLKMRPDIYFAGQITGVEGYLESAASGLYTAIQVDRHIKGLKAAAFTKKTCIGALQAYITDPTVTYFQPMNANFGIMEQPSDLKLKKIQKKIIRSKTALDQMLKLQNEIF